MFPRLVLDSSVLPVLAFYLYVAALLAILRLRLAGSSSALSRGVTAAAGAVAILLALGVSLSSFAAALPAPPCVGGSIFGSGYCENFGHGLAVVWRFFSLLVFFSLAALPLVAVARCLELFPGAASHVSTTADPLPPADDAK